MYQVYQGNDTFVLAIIISFFAGVFCMTVTMTIAQYFGTHHVEHESAIWHTEPQPRDSDEAANAENVYKPTLCPSTARIDHCNTITAPTGPDS